MANEEKQRTFTEILAEKKGRQNGATVLSLMSESRPEFVHEVIPGINCPCGGEIIVLYHNTLERGTPKTEEFCFCNSCAAAYVRFVVEALSKARKETAST